jgi:hypothetical protein
MNPFLTMMLLNAIPLAAEAVREARKGPDPDPDLESDPRPDPDLDSNPRPEWPQRLPRPRVVDAGAWQVPKAVVVKDTRLTQAGAKRERKRLRNLRNARGR